MSRILVVDDESPVRALIAGCLRIEGHQVTSVGNGVEGIAMLLSEPYDLAVIDLVMPGLSGYDTVEQIRQTPAIADIPIIMLSAATDPLNFVRSSQLRILEHIEKPAGFHQIEDAVKRALAPEDEVEELSEELRTLKKDAVKTYRQTIDLIEEIRANTPTMA